MVQYVIGVISTCISHLLYLLDVQLTTYNDSRCLAYWLLCVECKPHAYMFLAGVSTQSLRRSTEIDLFTYGITAAIFAGVLLQLFPLSDSFSLQIWSMKQDKCVFDFKEHTKVWQIFLCFYDSLNL